MSVATETGSSIGTVDGFREGVEAPHQPEITNAHSVEVDLDDERAETIAEEAEKKAEDGVEDSDSVFESLKAEAAYHITVSIRQLIGAGIILGLGIVILNQVFTMNLVTGTSGPFAVSTVTDPLGAALAIMGLALFVGGARVIMSQMGGGNGGRGGL